MKKVFAGALVLALMLSVAVAVSAKSVVIGGRVIQEQKGFYSEVPEIQISVSGRQIEAFSSQRGYLYLVLEYADGKEIFVLPNGRNLNNLLNPYEWRTVALLPDLSVETYKIKAVFSSEHLFSFYFKLNDLYLSTSEVEYLGQGGSCSFIACTQLYIAVMPDLPTSSCLPKGERMWHAYFPDGTDRAVTQSEMIWLIIHGY